MSNKIFVRRPQLGDYVCKRVSDRKVFYLDWQSADCPEGNMFEVDGETYEKIGSAVPYEGDKVLCLWREMATKPFCERYMFRLTGYVLDGAEHTSTLSIREASNGWGTAVDYDITYAATTVADFVAQLNAYFAATEVFSAAVQDWWAEVDDEGVVVNCKFINSPQGSNAGENSFSLVSDPIPNVKALNDMQRRNGSCAGENAICNFLHAVKCFSADDASTLYNPTSTITSVKQLRPICLPAYLGTSAYRNDMCAYLREVYGEGEQGWLKFMASVEPVLDTDFGAFGQRSGKKVTDNLAAVVYGTSNGSVSPFKAAKFCHDIVSDTVDEGEFWHPSIKEVASVMRHIRYNRSNNSTADSINHARQNAGWPLISSNYNISSSTRFYISFNVWGMGSNGTFIGDYLPMNSKFVLPVTQYQL